MATSKIIGGLNPLLQWLNELLNLFQTETIKVPTDYRQQVLKVKAMLEDDPSGLTNTILDFAISCALVNYRIETDNPNLTKILNDWLDSINEDLLGKIPTGLEALAKEYFRERWKGSSNILLRTFWAEHEGLTLPTSMFLVDGEDIKVERNSKDGVVRLGDEKYYIRVGNNDQINTSDSTQPHKPNDIKLPSNKNEILFAQKPFESWGVTYPVPFLIKRGVYHSSEFLRLMFSKGEFILGRALEYLLIMKKGTERMALEGQVTYDEEDLKKANEDLKNIINQKKSEGGIPSYATNFDTEFSDYIPDYQKAINATLYSPHEKKVLAGLGMIEIVEGIASTRREAILNPKPFIAEVEQGVSDFKSLLRDIIKVFIQKNLVNHKKWASAEIKIINSPIKAFIDDKTKTLIRSLYDRGTLSKRTLVEVAGNLDFDLEVNRRNTEHDEKVDELMYPPVILNQEAQEYTNVNKTGKPGTQKDSIDKTKHTDKKVTPDKTGPEKKNYTQSVLSQGVCIKCHYEGSLEEFVDDINHLEKSSIQCPQCNEYLELDTDIKISELTKAGEVKKNN